MCRKTEHICACGALINKGSKTKDCHGTQKQQTYLSSVELVDLDASLEPWDDQQVVDGHIIEIHRTYEQYCICEASESQSGRQLSGATEVAARQSQDFSSGSEPDNEEFSDEFSFRGSSPESDAPHSPRTPPSTHIHPAPSSHSSIDIGPPVHGVTRPFYCIVLYASCGCPAARQMHAKQFPFGCGQVRADAPVETTEFCSYILRGPRCLSCAKGSEMEDQHEISVEGMMLGLESVKLENGGEMDDLLGELDRMEMT